MLTRKPWGPNYLRFGLSLESSFDGGSSYNILIDYTMRWVNRLGAEWKNQVQFGETHLFFSEFYQPVFPTRALFIAPYFRWEQRFNDVYYGDDVIARYRIRQQQWGADLASSSGPMENCGWAMCGTRCRHATRSGFRVFRQST